jgi:hypothetical protein
MSGSDSLKPMRLRYPGSCRSCGTALPAGTTATYDRAKKSVTCIPCSASANVESIAEPATDTTPAPNESLELGKAGASARREYERRVTRREERVREAHPRIGAFLLAITDEPQSTQAWSVGAVGEEKLGRTLDGLADRGVHVLYDRRIPRTRANIDHIAISSSGVFVIDAKRYTGRPTLRIEGGIIRPRTETLMVGHRDCNKLVVGVNHQVELVRTALIAGELGRIPVCGVLCFIDAEWPLFGGSFSTAGVSIAWPKKVSELICAEPDISGDDVALALNHLAHAFPRA